MGKYTKLLTSILSGSSDKNIAFEDLCRLLLRLGFEQRIKGDHFIFSRAGVDEIINLQPLGKMTKPYQVKQVRQIILKYKLGSLDVDE
jgi:hypothetical protein